MLVTFSGIDCTGKSTQIAQLEKRIAASGKKVFSMWYRPGYSPLLDRARALVRKAAPSTLPTADVPGKREKAFSKPGVAAAWLVVAEIDMLTQYALRIRYHLARGHFVICDRYLDDAEFDLQMRFPQFSQLIRYSLFTLRRVCPTPDLAVLLTVSWDLMNQRSLAKNEPFPEDEPARKIRFDHYSRLASNANAYKVIDTSGTIDQVADQIWQLYMQIEAHASR